MRTGAFSDWEGAGCAWPRTDTRSCSRSDLDLSQPPNDAATQLPLRGSQNHKEIKDVSLWEVMGVNLAYWGDRYIDTYRVTVPCTRN